MASRLSRFEIRFAPLESDHPDPIERACAAELSIHVGDLCLTQLEDRYAQTVRPVLRASAYRLALWFAQNWWRLRWEPEQQGDSDWPMAHVLAAAGGGYTWPALSFIGDGESILLRMRPSAAVPTETVRYLLQADVPIPVDQLVEGIDAFVEAVIARLCASGHPNSDLEQLWSEVLDERRAAAVGEWRKLEALASLEPGSDEAGFLEPLLERRQQIGAGAIEELVAMAKSRAPATLAGLLDGGRRAATPLHCSDIVPLRRRALAYVEKATHGALGSIKPPPWQLGYDIAAMARQYWNLAPGKVTPAIIEQLFGISETVLAQPTLPAEFPLSAGYRDDATDTLAVWLGMRRLTGRRFALARLVGDHLCSDELERLLPATATKTARQKFQRAFAQQFLCPIDDLKAFLNTDNPDDEQMEDAASEFEVSPLLIKTTLVNHGLLDREALRELR